VLAQVQAITRRETKTIPTAANAGDDVGGFTVLTDASHRDRSDTDRIAKGAFDQSLKRWQDSGERIPLYWKEIPSSRDQIGFVDPATYRDVGGFGPFFGGSIDFEGDHRAKAHDAWTAIKSDAVEVEVSYVLLANDEADGVRTLQEVDVTGLTLKPTSEGRLAIREARTLEARELKRKSQELRLEVLLGPSLYADLQARKADPEPESSVPTDAELRTKCKALGFAVPTPPRIRERRPMSLDEVRAEAAATITAQLLGVDHADAA
jgi:hypothetical protein